MSNLMTVDATVEGAPLTHLNSALAFRSALLKRLRYESIQRGPSVDTLTRTSVHNLYLHHMEKGDDSTTAAPG